MGEWVYLNGEVVRRSEAAISPMDRGFLYGDGFFETLRIEQGRTFRLAEHIERLNMSCCQTGWQWALDPQQMERVVGDLIGRNGIERGYLRVTVSRGPHERSLTDLRATRPTVFVEMHAMELAPLDDPPPFVLARSSYVRDPRSPTLRQKSLSYQANLLALAEGRRNGADEVFFVDPEGNLTEGAITNIFLVQGSSVLTAAVDCGILPGITRGAVLRLCEAEGIECRVGRHRAEALERCDELFCTNSLRGVVPVKRVSGGPDREFLRWPITRRLQSRYAELFRQECGLAPGGR